MTVACQGKDVDALSGELDLEDRFALVAGFNWFKQNKRWNIPDVDNRAGYGSLGTAHKSLVGVDLERRHLAFVKPVHSFLLAFRIIQNKQTVDKVYDFFSAVFMLFIQGEQRSTGEWDFRLAQRGRLGFCLQGWQLADVLEKGRFFIGGRVMMNVGHTVSQALWHESKDMVILESDQVGLGVLMLPWEWLIAWSAWVNYLGNYFVDPWEGCLFVEVDWQLTVFK